MTKPTKQQNTTKTDTTNQDRKNQSKHQSKSANFRKSIRTSKETGNCFQPFVRAKKGGNTKRRRSSPKMRPSSVKERAVYEDMVTRLNRSLAARAFRRLRRNKPAIILANK